MSEPDALTRRLLVSRAITAGGLIAGGSALGAVITPLSAEAAAAPETDGQLVYATLAVELLVIAVYERVIASGKLSVDHAPLAYRLLSYERVHARVLAKDLRALGMAEPPSLAGASTNSLDAILTTKQVQESLATIANDADSLALLIRVEEVAEGAYYHAISKLTDPRLLLRSAQIMASEAQHRTILSQTRDPGALVKAVPVAFVQGRG